MRQLYVEVPQHAADQAEQQAYEHDGINIWRLPARTQRDDRTLLLVHLPNSQVGPYIQSLEEFDDVHLTLIPRGVVTFHPPADEPPEEVTDVEMRSPIEIVLSGLQSIGSFKGFVGYAVVAGVVAWIGLFTNTIYLLTASMLIAPFAGPAMNAAIGTATGSTRLLKRSVLRYAVGLGLAIATAGALSFALNQQIATPLMIEVSQLSIVSILLPLAAGAAGALYLMQSDQDSLVSGAAVGVLVAASLAPPTALLGMAAVMTEWDLVKSAAFVLVVQLAGINLTGAVFFRLFGLESEGTRFIQGSRWLFPSALTISAAVLIGLFVLQHVSAPDFQRSSRSQRAAHDIRQVIDESGLGEPIEVEARFTRADIPDQHTLLGVVYVQRGEGITQPADELEAELTRQIQARLLAEGYNFTPFIDVSVLDPPGRVRSRE